jgi:hypothetical protein
MAIVKTAENKLKAIPGENPFLLFDAGFFSGFSGAGDDFRGTLIVEPARIVG